ncbi:hypothetical protein PUW48_00025 [Streptococcus anginosus]|nr:hypothetical protein PUW48_00025 [Streptococcus anginosus]
MKKSYFKQLLLGFVTIVSLIILGACGAKKKQCHSKELIKVYNMTYD